MIITVWHTTTHERALAILAGGFKDHRAERRTMFSGTFGFGQSGVWISTLPAIDDELFDGVGMFGFDAGRQAFLTATVEEAQLRPGEWKDESWTAGRQFLVPAKMLNALTWKTATLSEAAALRIDCMSAGERADMKRWAAPERGYGEPLLAAVRAALNSD